MIPTYCGGEDDGTEPYSASGCVCVYAMHDEGEDNLQTWLRFLLTHQHLSQSQSIDKVGLVCLLLLLLLHLLQMSEYYYRDQL